MKGQFLLISAIIVGGILIGLTGTISEARSETYEASSRFDYRIDSIREQASKALQGSSTPEDRERFRRSVASLPYQTEVDYWSSQDCFNVSLRSPSRSAYLNCVG